MYRNFGDGALDQPGAQPGRVQPGRVSPRYPPGFEPQTGIPVPAKAPASKSAISMSSPPPLILLLLHCKYF
jgi:hypothetical protein